MKCAENPEEWKGNMSNFQHSLIKGEIEVKKLKVEMHWRTWVSVVNGDVTLQHTQLPIHQDGLSEN